MKFLRLITIAVAVIVVLATDASSAGKVTTLEATLDKIILLIDWSRNPFTTEDFHVVIILGVEHCKKYDWVIGTPHTKMRPQVMNVTIPCDGNNKTVSKNQKKSSTENQKAPQKKKRSRLLKSWE